MSRPGHCDVCGMRIDHHRPSKHRADHPFACAWDDDVRARRAARREGLSPVFSSSVWAAGPERVDGCMATGCLRGRHGIGWYRYHEYEPPPPAVLLDRMRERRARRILRRVAARGTWEITEAFQVWLDDDCVCDDWDVNRTYGDWPTMLTVTRERLGIPKFVVPVPDGRDRWTLYSLENDVTVIIERRVVGTLVRP